MPTVNRWHFEDLARSQGYTKIAGVDEAGRGPLAGPLFVAACILPQSVDFSGIADSKKLSESQRERVYEDLVSHPGVFYSIVRVEPDEIDAVNILQATMQGMQRAIKALQKIPDFVLVDGNRSPQFLMPSQAVVKGDDLSFSIGAASILAKVSRDRVMMEYDRLWPEYGFAKHKGYPTKLHQEALIRLGPCPIHRLSYVPVRAVL